VGSADVPVTNRASIDDVASSVRKYQEPGITHVVLSDTPYLPEVRPRGAQLLPLVRS
jgi:alkanesulfonate monooxygenase